ncbi:3489_t:CDS:2, partial [Cetraspora pellucida]
MKIRNFLIESEFATEKIRKQFQAKYKELLGSSLEKQGQMFDDNNLDERLKSDQQIIRGKTQPETFLPEDASKTRYKPKENIYKKRPSSPASDNEDFKLAIKEFINKNVINLLFRRHSRNSNTTSLSQIPSKLKNKVNLEENKEFKLQNSPISRLKRQRSIKKDREIIRKMFEESKKEDITLADERNIKELDKYKSDKEEETQKYKVLTSEDRDSLYAYFKEMLVEVPFMNIEHIRIENLVENKYIDTPVNLAKKEIIVQPVI